MAPGGSNPHRSFCQNPPPIGLVENEFARDPGSVGGLYSGVTSLALSRNPTPGPNLIFAPILAPVLTLTHAPVFALTPAPVPTDKLFKKFIKTYLELNQEPRQPPTERKQIFKVKVPKVYYSKSHMDCYHFYQ